MDSFFMEQKKKKAKNTTALISSKKRKFNDDSFTIYKMMKFELVYKSKDIFLSPFKPFHKWKIF